MRVLATMPGKFGDILWCLPTVRVLAEAAGEPVDFCTSEAYKSILPLIQEQEYIGKATHDESWQVQDTAPMTPQRPTNTAHSDVLYSHYDKVIHLGYPQWPQSLLAADIYIRAVGQWGKALPELDLDTPWIQLDPEHEFRPDNDDYAERVAGTELSWHPDVHVGWSDEWAELKMGVLYALTGKGTHNYQVLTVPGSRIQEEWLRYYPGDEPDEVFENLSWYAARWYVTADALNRAKIFLGCLSSQWVLANALGKPTVIMEPNPHRHNPIFFYDHPRNHLVKGNDGKPTFDARHVADMVKEVLTDAKQ